jgi:hypothetical protein
MREMGEQTYRTICGGIMYKAVPQILVVNVYPHFFITDGRI